MSAEWVAGRIHKTKRPITARNARRIERKLNKDIGHGRNQKQLGREGQKEEGSGDSAIL